MCLYTHGVTQLFHHFAETVRTRSILRTEADSTDGRERANTDQSNGEDAESTGRITDLNFM